MASIAQAFRIESIPSRTTIDGVLSLFSEVDRTRTRVKSLARHPYDDTLVATVSFTPPDGTLRHPMIDKPELTIDDDFEGLTTLHDGESADIVAVSDLFEHPYYSWSNSVERAWLRDALPKDVKDTCIMLYGHDVELHSERGLLEACAEAFLQRMEQALTRRRTGAKPMVLLGVRTGCRVIEKAVIMACARADKGMINNLAGVIFFDAPHTGLSDHILELLPEGRSKSVIASELKVGSSTLQKLDADFGLAIATTTTISCVSKEVLGDSSGSSNWKPSKIIVHEGRREAIAQLRRTPTGQYRRVIQEIKQCLGLLQRPTPPTQYTRRPESFVNFSLPVRSPSSPLFHDLKRKDSLSPLASPSLRESTIDETKIDLTSEAWPIREMEVSRSPCTLQRITDAAALGSTPTSSVSGHSSGSSISSLQSLVAERHANVFRDSPISTPASPATSSLDFPFPSIPQWEASSSSLKSHHVRPSKRSSSSTDSGHQVATSSTISSISSIGSTEERSPSSYTTGMMLFKPNRNHTSTTRLSTKSSRNLFSLFKRAAAAPPNPIS